MPKTYCEALVHKPSYSNDNSCAEKANMY